MCSSAYLCGHQQDGNDLVHTSEAARINLAYVDGTCGEELLEHDAVLAHLARGNADAVRLQGFPDGLVSENCAVLERSLSRQCRSCSMPSRQQQVSSAR
jgi:hypothetical protein